MAQDGRVRRFRGARAADLKRAAAALLASAAFTSIVFLTAPTIAEGPDFVRLHRINRAYAAARIAEGELPLWNPHVGLGRPFLADIETALFYPPNVVYLLLDPITSLALLAALHGAMGLLAMRAFCRRLGATDAAAWAAGGVWLAGAPFVEEMLAGRSSFALGASYLPLAFLAARSAMDGPSLRRVAALAAVLALQLLAGHPHIAWITWLGLGVFLAGRMRGPSLSGPAILAAAIAWAGALCAVQLMPLAELARNGNRATRSLEFAASGAMHAAEWSSLVLVPAFSEQFLLYVGIATLLAGLCGLLAVTDPDRRGLLATALAGAALAAGTATPVFRVAYVLLPGLSFLRNPSRFGILVCFALVAGAAAHLSAPRAPRRSWLLAAVTGLVAVAILAGHRAGLATTERPLAWSLVVTVCSAATLAWWQRAGHSRRAAGAALLAVVALDLATAIAAHKRTISWPDDLRAEPAIARALVEGGLLDPGGVPPRISVPYWIIRDNAGALYGYSTYTGYVSLTLGRVWAYVHDVLRIPRPGLENTYPSKEVYAHGPFPYDTMNLRLGFDVATSRLVTRPAADPRAYVVARTRVVRDWPEALRAMVAGHDPHREALVEEPLLAETAADAADAPVGTARITRFTPESLIVEVDTATPALLVLAEAWYPGWRATVNGAPAACAPANVWMRAVPVPRGRSEVRLTYRSTYLPAGAALSLAAVLALAVALRPRVRPA